MHHLAMALTAFARRGSRYLILKIRHPIRLSDEQFKT
jgi:hypothetical protein